MLIYFPFIFFSALTIYLWKKKQYIDVAIFLSAEYALTSFFAILCVKMDLLGAGGILFTRETLELNFVPTLLYCTLITITIIPFSKLDIYKIKNIYNPSQLIFSLFSYFLIAIALLNIYIIIDNIIAVFQEGDFASVRASHYDGEKTAADLKAESLPSILRYLYYFNRSTILALPCFFYSLCFLKKHWIYNCTLLFAALSLPLSGIQNADRTEFIFFAQTLIVSFLLFRPYFQTAQKRFLKRIMIPLCILFILYLSAVTIARFAERETGASGGSIQYAGQNYLNFCYFYEYANNDNVYTTRMFPFVNHMFKDMDYADTKEIQSEQQGFFIGVFASFLGVFLLDTGLIGLLLWILAFYIITHLTFRFDNMNQISLGNLIGYYVLATIPAFGIFYYPYIDYMQGIFLILSVCISILLHYKFKIKE